MKYLIFLCCMLICLEVDAQNDSTKVDDAAAILKADSIAMKTADSISMASVQEKKNFKYFFGHISRKGIRRSAKFDLQIDTRNSFVKDFPINVYGVNIGVIFNERLRLGAGYYWINQSFNDKLLGINSSTGRVVVTPKGVPIPVSTLQQWEAQGKIPPGSYVAAAQQIDLWFASVGMMYTFYVSRLVEFAIPIEIGYGKFSEKLSGDFSTLNASLKPQATTGNFMPGQIGFDMLIKPHRWIYLEGSIGYRKTLAQNYNTKYRATNLDSQFDGEYYNIGIKLQIGTIVKERKAHRLKKKGEKLPIK